MKTLQHSKKVHKSNNPGFGNGLIIGSLLGIAAYYVFGTKSGEKVRHEFVQEYQDAKKTIDKQLKQLAVPASDSVTKKKTSNQTQSSIIHNLLQVFPNMQKKVAQKSNISSQTSSDKTQSTPKPSPKQFFTRFGKKLS